MRENIPLLGRCVARFFQKYWRVTRGLHLSVEACVTDESGRVLMVRNENGTSWELPGGAVHKNENLETALRRVIGKVAGIEVNGKPELRFFYTQGANEQRGVFLVRHWHQASSPSHETRFLPWPNLPAGPAQNATERIRRCLEDRTTSEV